MAPWRGEQMGEQVDRLSAGQRMGTEQSKELSGGEWCGSTVLGWLCPQHLGMLHPATTPFWPWKLLKGSGGQSPSTGPLGWLPLCILRHHQAPGWAWVALTDFPVCTSHIQVSRWQSWVGSLGRGAGGPCCPPCVSPWLSLVARALDLESDFLGSSPGSATS